MFSLRWLATGCAGLLLLALVVGCEAPPGEQGGHPWAWWVEHLRDPDPAERERAVGVLRGWPGSPAAAMLPLVYASCDPDGYVRAAALESVAPQVRVGPELIAVLERGLLDAHPDVRISAAKGLEGLGAAAAPAMPWLEVAGLDADGQVSWAAIRAMAATGEPAIPPLLRWLGSADEREVFAGLSLFDRIEGPVPSAIPLVSRLLVDPRPRVRGSAMLCADQLGAAAIDVLPQLILACSDSDFSTKAAMWGVAKTLGKAALPVLLAHADCADPGVRKIALSELLRTPELRRECVDQLRLAARDPDVGVRATMFAMAVGEVESVRRANLQAGRSEDLAREEFAEHWEWLLPAAEEGLEDSNRDVREWATRLVAELRPASPSDVARLRPSISCTDRERLRILAGVVAEEALPDVLNWLRHANPGVRAAAAAVLADRVAPGESSGPHLVQLLEDEDPRVRLEAARALDKRFGKEEIACGILRLAHDPDPQVRRQALLTIGRNRPAWAEPIVELLVTALHDPEAEVRRSAVWGLARQGPAAREAARDLAAALSDSDREVRESAVSALEALHVRVPEAVPFLMDRLRDASILVRKHAVSALGLVAQPSDEVIRGILESLDDPLETAAQEVPAALAALGSDALPYLLDLEHHGDSWVRRCAVDALGFLPDPSREVYDALIRASRDYKEEVRIAAVHALGRHLTRDDAVRPALERALRDRRPSVRSAAGHALGK